MQVTRSAQLKTELDRVITVLEATPPIDTTRAISGQEYRARQRRVWEAVADLGCDAGFVFSNEHYEGDVPYLAGNTNITVEQVAGVIGANGFHVIAGLEGGYVVEQPGGALGRAGAQGGDASAWPMRTIQLTPNDPRWSSSRRAAGCHAVLRSSRRARWCP